MSCQETQNLLQGYVDGELDLVRSLRIEQHIHECPTCAQAFAQHRSLSEVLRAGPLYYMPSGTLQTRLRSRLRHASPAETGPWGWSRRWLGLVAASVVVAIVLWSIVPGWLASSSQNQLLQELVAGHVRSLMVDHLTDVSSSDPHTVKPWFEGKLDFSPQVGDLRERGFPLFGGRLDYLDHRPVAALVYQRRQHIINLYSWPSMSQADVSMTTVMRQGYQLIRWSMGGITYWAVSNLNLRELQEFAQIVQQQVSPPSSFQTP